LQKVIFEIRFVPETKNAIAVIEGLNESFVEEFCVLSGEVESAHFRIDSLA
jgi:hypothetical protein